MKERKGKRKGRGRGRGEGGRRGAKEKGGGGCRDKDGEKARKFVCLVRSNKAFRRSLRRERVAEGEEEGSLQQNSKRGWGDGP